MKYRMYIDEAGNAKLQPEYKREEQYLCLTGVIIDHDYVRTTVAPQIEALKARHFTRHHPDEPILFHRVEMVPRREKPLQPPFEILNDESKRQEFNNELLALLKAWDYTVISVCIDKDSRSKEYAHKSYALYYLCLEKILTCYAAFLRYIGEHGDVIIESGGTNKDFMIKQEFTRIYIAEDLHHVLSGKELLVKEKPANIAGLQIADLLAHESRTEILHDNGR